MSAEDPKSWTDMARKLRRALGLEVSTPDEAEKELEAEEEAPYTEEEIDTIVAAATASLPEPEASASPDEVAGAWVDAIEPSAEALPVLNRNKAEGSNSDALLDEIRARELGGTTRAKPDGFDWRDRRNREDAAAKCAEEIFSSLQISSPPVDPFAIARDERRRLNVVARDFGDRFDGQLEYHPDRRRFLLFVNTKYDRDEEHSPRTRFSMAHELAHFYLDHHREFLMGGGKAHGSASEFASDASIEREADAFAAAILMPSQLMRPLVNEGELSNERVKALACEFQTSLVSTMIRSVLLSDFPCAVVGLRGGTRAWSFHSTSLIEAGCYPRARLSKKSLPPEGTVGDWFKTYKEGLDEIYASAEFTSVPVMDLVLVLITVSEDDLFSGDWRS